jgi:hypothetical protein
MNKSQRNAKLSAETAIPRQYFTKAGNLLLRSTHAASLALTLEYVMTGRIRLDDNGLWTIRSADGQWIGNCSGSINALHRAGYVLVSESRGTVDISLFGQDAYAALRAIILDTASA